MPSCSGTGSRRSAKVDVREVDVTEELQEFSSEAEGNEVEQTSFAVATDTTPEMVVESPTVLDLEGLSVYYGAFRAVRDVDLAIRSQEITAMIGPSGCGKSTVLRCFNRMNDLIPTARVEGKVHFHGVDLYDKRVDPVEVRRRIGMVFQKPNPFPKSIYDNVTYGPRIAGVPKSDFDGIVERSLRKAALWEEVKDRLKESALGMSGGQQQRLCIARAIASNPDVLLMDEPCSASTPSPPRRIEELMHEIKRELHHRDRHPQHATGGAGERSNSISSPPSPTVRTTGEPAFWSNMRQQARSSPTPLTCAPRTTSLAGSAKRL